MQLNKCRDCVRLVLIRANLPQVQPECAVESVLWQRAFLQTDTPRKHAPSEACCASPPAPNQTQERSLLCVFAAITHQHSCLQTCQNSHAPLDFRFHTHTHTHRMAFWIAKKSSGDINLRFLPCAKLAPPMNVFTWEALWGEAERIVFFFLRSVLECSRAQPNRGSG